MRLSAAEQHYSLDIPCCSCSITILPQGVTAAACDVCVVLTVSLSSPPTQPLPLAFTSVDWWAAKVIYLSLSSCIHPVFTHKRMHACTFTKTHCTHWFTEDCKRDTIYKRPPGCTLFVCLHLWLRFGSLHSPLSSTVPTSKYSFMYFFIWSYPVQTRTSSRHFWFRTFRGNQVLDV